MYFTPFSTSSGSYRRLRTGRDGAADSAELARKWYGVVAR